MVWILLDHRKALIRIGGSEANKLSNLLTFPLLHPKSRPFFSLVPRLFPLLPNHLDSAKVWVGASSRGVRSILIKYLGVAILPMLCT